MVAHGRPHQQSCLTLPSSALPPESVGPVLSYGKTRWKSARLRVRSCCLAAQPLSTSLQSGLRFLQRPVPAVPSACLTAAYPRRRTTGLPRSVYRPEWVRFRLFAGGAYVCERRRGNASAWPLTFWFKPLRLATRQPLGLVGSHDVYQRFTWVSHTIRLWLPTALRLAVVIAPRGLDDHLAVRLHCPRGSHTADCSHCASG